MIYTGGAGGRGGVGAENGKRIQRKKFPLSFGCRNESGGEGQRGGGGGGERMGWDLERRREEGDEFQTVKSATLLVD